MPSMGRRDREEAQAQRTNSNTTGRCGVEKHRLFVFEGCPLCCCPPASQVSVTAPLSQPL